MTVQAHNLEERTLRRAPDAPLSSPAGPTLSVHKYQTGMIQNGRPASSFYNKKISWQSGTKHHGVSQNVHRYTLFGFTVLEWQLLETRINTETLPQYKAVLCYTMLLLSPILSTS